MREGQVEFMYDGERFVGQSSELPVMSGERARLVLASSLDQALASLRAFSGKSAILALVSCLVAAVASQVLARAIARPVRQLVDGTERIAAGAVR
jgi:nitrogen fixation/metabolism regulation signal transduction histidine kinase